MWLKRKLSFRRRCTAVQQAIAHNNAETSEVTEDVRRRRIAEKKTKLELIRTIRTRASAGSAGCSAGLAEPTAGCSSGLAEPTAGCSADLTEPTLLEVARSAGSTEPTLPESAVSAGDYADLTEPTLLESSIPAGDSAGLTTEPTLLRSEELKQDSQNEDTFSVAHCSHQRTPPLTNVSATEFTQN